MPKVAVPELALDHKERHTGSHLDGVSVGERTWREPAPHFGRGRDTPHSARAAAGGQWRPRVVPLMTEKSGPTGR
jgi:hypothetical protein